MPDEEVVGLEAARAPLAAARGAGAGARLRGRARREEAVRADRLGDDERPLRGHQSARSRQRLELRTATASNGLPGSASARRGAGTPSSRRDRTRSRGCAGRAAGALRRADRAPARGRAPARSAPGRRARRVRRRRARATCASSARRRSTRSRLRRARRRSGSSRRERTCAGFRVAAGCSDAASSAAFGVAARRSMVPNLPQGHPGVPEVTLSKNL